MKKYPDKILIEAIFEFTGDLQFHLKDFNRDNYFKNVTVRDAVMRSLQKITETYQRLSDETKQAFPSVEWNKISGFRNFIVHEYLGDIDHNIVWSVIEDYIPTLNKSLKKYYESKF